MDGEGEEGVVEKSRTSTALNTTPPFLALFSLNATSLEKSFLFLNADFWTRLAGIADGRMTEKVGYYVIRPLSTFLQLTRLIRYMQGDPP
jgi:hypothetical protein